MVKAPDIKEYYNKHGLLFPTALFKKLGLFQVKHELSTDKLSKYKHNSLMNAGGSFKIAVGANIPKAVAPAALLPRSEPSSEQSGSMPTSGPNVPLLSFAPQESKLPEIRPDKPCTSISSLCSQIPMVKDYGKNHIWQQLKTVDNPTISAILGTGVQVTLHCKELSSSWLSKGVGTNIDSKSMSGCIRNSKLNQRLCTRAHRCHLQHFRIAIFKR